MSGGKMNKIMSTFLKRGGSDLRKTDPGSDTDSRPEAEGTPAKKHKSKTAHILSDIEYAAGSSARAAESDSGPTTRTTVVSVAGPITSSVADCAARFNTGAVAGSIVESAAGSFPASTVEAAAGSVARTVAESTSESAAGTDAKSIVESVARSAAAAGSIAGPSSGSEFTSGLAAWPTASSVVDRTPGYNAGTAAADAKAVAGSTSEFSAGSVAESTAESVAVPAAASTANVF